MIPLYEFNRIVVLVSSLPLEKKKNVGSIAIFDAINRISIQAKDVNPDEIIQNSINLGLIHSRNARLSLTNRGNNLLKLQKVEDNQIIVDDLTEEQEKEV